MSKRRTDERAAKQGSQGATPRAGSQSATPHTGSQGAIPNAGSQGATRRKGSRGETPREPRHGSAPPPPAPLQRGAGFSLWDWFVGPQPIERLELLRILAPLCIVGFMSARALHADHWLGVAGFHVPPLGGDFRQPLYLEPLPNWAAWSVAWTLIVSGLTLSLGLLTRLSGGLFALTMAYVALADRLSAFTVSKLGTIIAVILFVSPCGSRYGVDAWRRMRRGAPAPTLVSGPLVRFVQILLVSFYACSGICKAGGDWLSNWNVLWSHLYDSYQTSFSFHVSNATPSFAWAILQGITLVYELLAPLWFSLPVVRYLALAWGLSMHAMIGLMFGPVIWFSLLMCSLLVTCFLPLDWLRRVFARVPG